MVQRQWVLEGKAVVVDMKRDASGSSGIIVLEIILVIRGDVRWAVARTGLGVLGVASGI